MEGRPYGSTHYLVLSRSWADLYAEIAGVFADRPDIKVVVDRRRGRDGVKAAPGAAGRRVLMDEGRLLSARLVPVQFREEAS